jgi:oligoribonuclease (3'-5' exoribonuclease)
MVDIETLGTGIDAPVFQIAATAFNITTGEIISSFDELIDVKSFKNIDGNTLLWWLETNTELLKKLATESTKSKKTEKKIFSEFFDWISAFVDKFGQEKVFLWGNGILFDNRILKEKAIILGLDYPIFYRNDRDLRTLIELASFKLGISTDEFKSLVPFIGTAHNAIKDVDHQISLALKAYSKLVFGDDEF